MNTTSYPYLNMLCQDASGIHVENWQESWSVDMHCHDYYELMLVASGSCRHVMHGSKTLLIPGDAILISPHTAHGYELNAQISLYNCQFRPERLDPAVTKLLDNQEGLTRAGEESRESQEPYTAFWQHLFADREDMHTSSLTAYEVNSCKQGVLHLPPTDLTYMVSLLEHLLGRQEGDGSDYPLLKQKYVEMILLEMHQAIQTQSHRYAAFSAAHQRIIAEILAEMEKHLAEPFDISQVAKKYSFSPNYLRKLFKDFTGAPPIQYLNRLRIIYACECMEQEGMDSKSAAEDVGIYDMNYFSRLFKQIMGYSPSRISRTGK